MKKETRSIFFSLVLVACCATAAGITTSVVSRKNGKQSPVYVTEKGQPFGWASQTAMPGRNQPVDLTEAAEKTVHGVVHIKSTVAGSTQIVQEMPDIFEYFFGNGRPRQRRIESQPQVGYGSGVILSEDGYIVTNNHVIEHANDIEVTLNDSRTFKATVIGTDENSDLALLKIDCEDKLPFIPMGNSDDLKLGEWVLAVGNPFNLTSTVTAGVVSAKARKIGIYDSGESIESFIQTDAAINMGNSGGALVNVNGELVGINSALESPTGTYAGYGFAIPTTIVRKVVADLKEYGAVQRALLGIMGGDVAAMRQLEENKDKDFGSVYEGVYVSELTERGGAADAGIKEGDIITEVDGRKVRTMTELQETVMQHRPGDVVEVTLVRDRKQKKVSVELKNAHGSTDVIKKTDSSILGATFQNVPDDVRRRFNLGYGIQVKSLQNGQFKKNGIKAGFIILSINSRQIRSEEDINEVYQEAVKSADQVLFITGIYQDGRRAHYAVDLSEE